jgi:hypothetical protein
MESYLSMCDSVAGVVRSLTATNSMSGLPSAVRKTLRPMRPKPLMPTLTAMEVYASFLFREQRRRLEKKRKPGVLQPLEAIKARGWEQTWFEDLGRGCAVLGTGADECARGNEKRICPAVDLGLNGYGAVAGTGFCTGEGERS